MKKLIFAAALAVLPSIAHAQVSCYVGSSAGGTITKTSAPGVTIASDGAMAGGEVGCDYKMGQFLVGGLGRFDFADIKTSVAGGTIKQDAVWTAALRAGYLIQPAVLLYGVAGMTGTNIDYANIASLDRNGIMGGAGIEVELTGNLALFAEYSHTEFKKWTDGFSGDSLKPSSDAARVGVRFRFGSLLPQ